MKLLLTLAVSATALTASGFAASPDDVPYVLGASLPPDAWDALTKGNSYAIDARINPYYLQGDFDGDGWLDTAVLVKERATGKTGAALVFRGGKVRIIGGGKDIGDGTTDLDWMDAWYVERKGKAQQGATDESPPDLKGDAIMAIKTESASGLIYWDGNRFRWYQQGD